MKLSIVIPVLASYEVVRRQLLHFERIGLPADTELIIVDDGSDPPLMDHPGIRNKFVRPCTAFPPGTPRVTDAFDDVGMNICIMETLDNRPWTWALARNAGARIAEGEYLLMFDIDHIVPGFAINFIREFTGLKVQFVREFGVLDENGVLTQDRGVLEEYGLPRDKGLGIGPHPNMFAMRRDLFWELGGYREDLAEKPYPQGEDRGFRSKWRTFDPTGAKVCTHRPRIYMFPNGKYLGDVDSDPQRLFHGLSRKTRRNFWHQQQKEETGVTR